MLIESMKTIYVAGPYTKGDVARNVSRAIEVGETLVFMGVFPYIPHLTHFWHLIYPHEINFWYKLDLVWLLKCDALYRIKGESIGADKEEEVAKNNGIPVLYNFGEVREWILDD